MKFTTNGMEHTPSTTMVFQSNEYNLFRMIKGNRTLDMNKIKKIMSDIERGCNLLKYVPVLVVENNGMLDIVDGQHRFMTAKKKKEPVHYIIAEALSLYDIARMNSNTEKWKAKDFINCYQELGNNNYEYLENFMKAYPGLVVTVAISLLSQGKVQGSSFNKEMDKFHRGEFEVKYENQANMIMEKAKAFEFSDKYSKNFLYALAKVIDAAVYELDELARKVNENSAMLQKQDHWRKYLTNMEEIVSKGKQKRVAIY